MNKEDYTVKTEDQITTIDLHNKVESNWKCYMFGGCNAYSVVWIPAEGTVPCWFWRKMQYLCFGHKWVKR